MLRFFRKSEGFTLVELLIVVAIIGILAAIAIPQFAAYREKAYCSAIKSDLANIAISQEAYFTDNDAYVVTGDGTSPEVEGFAATPNVTLALGTPNGATIDWSATGVHPNCDAGNTTYTWNSANGGLQ